MNDAAQPSSNLETDQTFAALAPLIAVIMEYEDSREHLALLNHTAAEILGDGWREIIHQYTAAYDEETRNFLDYNLERSANFEAAANAWDEAAYLLDDANGATPEYIEQRLPDLRYWLAIFGEDGAKVCDQLANKAILDPPSECPPAIIEEKSPEDFIPGDNEIISRLEAGIDREVLWEFNYFMKLKDYYEQTLQRTSARCVRLGGLLLTQYKHYGYILDLLDELIVAGNYVREHRELAPLIEKRFEKGREEFESYVSMYEKEYSDNATPDMLKPDDNELDRLIAGLGKLDTSLDKEDLTIDVEGISGMEFDDSAPPPPPPPPVKKITDF